MIRVLLSLLGLVLAISGAALLLGGTFHFGVVFSLGLGAILLALSLAWTPLRRWFQATSVRRWFWRATWSAATIWGVSVPVFVAMTMPHRPASAAVAPSDAPKAVIVLGSGGPTCTPTPVMQSRLDKALEVAEQSPTALLVLSGGVNHFHNLACTEAQVMHQALARRGLAEARIVEESRSTDTTENMVDTARLLRDRGIGTDQPMALVTSEFHGARAMRVAARQGFSHLEFVPAPTPIRYRFHLWLREYFAFAWSMVKGEI